MKRCPLCRETKDASEFYEDANRSDGLSGYCRPCNKLKAHIYGKAGVILRHRHREEFDQILGELWASIR